MKGVKMQNPKILSAQVYQILSTSKKSLSVHKFISTNHFHVTFAYLVI